MKAGYIAKRLSGATAFFRDVISCYMDKFGDQGKLGAGIVSYSSMPHVFESKGR
jgi:hypothetical protein